MFEIIHSNMLVHLGCMGKNLKKKNTQRNHSTQEIWPTKSIMDGPKSQFRKDEKSIDN